MTKNSAINGDRLFEAFFGFFMIMAGLIGTVQKINVIACLLIGGSGILITYQACRRINEPMK